MKKMQTGLIIAIIASVFFISFLIGRATVLKKSADEEKHITYNGIVPVPGKEEKSIETTGEAEKVPEKRIQKNATEETVSLPQRMLFPCGEEIQKDYSQTAVYSETMGDWRAHTGIDYAAEIGEEVFAVWDGIVDRVYVDKLWGNTVEISHTNELKSVYKNLGEEVLVKEGQSVEGGQAIGYVGNTADLESLEAPHLHFEMWHNNLTINPISYIY